MDQENIGSNKHFAVTLTNSFLISIRQHIEEGLKRDYIQYVFFPDMGHAHAFIPQKFYEALACGIPPVVANVGELAALLENTPQFFYEDGDVAGLVDVIKRQLQQREAINLPIPSWTVQALKLQQFMHAVLGND